MMRSLMCYFFKIQFKVHVSYSRLCNMPATPKLLFFVYILIYIAGSCICEAQGGDYEISSPMEKSEEEAFYNVMKAINYELDWRAFYPDPCGETSPQGTSCEVLDGLWHVTTLSFGPVYDNTPPCARNATIDISIAQLTHLKSLSFYKCFTHTNVSIPSDIDSLKASLQSLTFRNNGALVGGIPATIGGLLNLERLVITGAKVEGSIPLELGQLEHLVQLDLSNNKLGGSIPSSLGKLRNLVVLDLSKNHLIGSTPSSLGGLSRVEKLDFSRNMLGGLIPLEMGFLKGLKLLDMSFNKLQGNIPSSFSGLSSLQGLDLSHNSFNGALPINVWGSLKHLMSLDLSNAGFEGMIPSSLGFLESLRYLSLEDNRLRGGIPGGLGRLSYLYLLHLNGNNLSGQLPFTLAFVEQLGPNLQLYGNKELCSIVPNGNSLRVCSSSSDAVPYQDGAQILTSNSSLVSHLTNSSASPPRPFPNLLFTFIICRLLLPV